MEFFAERKRRKEEREQTRLAFFESPQGIARIAYARGDLVLEIETAQWVHLNAICHEGWELLSGVAHPDHTHTRFGLRHYLFKRAEHHWREPEDDWGQPF